MESSELTSEKVFQLLLEEIMRDGDISEIERSTLNEVKQALGVTSEQHQRAWQAAVGSLKARGKQAEYELVPEDVFRRVAARACADGQVSETEKLILEKVSRALRVDPEEHRVIWKAIEQAAAKA
ncbi:MAG: tellurite resistance TerB family protein [Candidatus Wallbacteria bacterium]|nr:tellurite resistance TerB family protein [Candidatus Wallbacteria bacterium]